MLQISMHLEGVSGPSNTTRLWSGCPVGAESTSGETKRELRELYTLER